MRSAASLTRAQRLRPTASQRSGLQILLPLVPTAAVRCVASKASPQPAPFTATRHDGNALLDLHCFAPIRPRRSDDGRDSQWRRNPLSPAFGAGRALSRFDPRPAKPSPKPTIPAASRLLTAAPASNSQVFPAFPIAANRPTASFNPAYVRSLSSARQTCPATSHNPPDSRIGCGFP